MRWVATGALVFCAMGMVVCRLLEDRHPWLGWLRAFCEAGTIGALADWFAVVALFRHPLGLPIPHTAILPKSKGRVATSVADFIGTNFLMEERLGSKFRAFDYAGWLAGWLERNGEALAGRMAAHIPRLLDGISDKAATGLLAGRARDLLAKAEIGPLLGGALRVALDGEREERLFGYFLASAEDLIASNRGMIQAKIKDEIPIPVEIFAGIPGINLVSPVLDEVKTRIAEQVADRTIQKVKATLDEVRCDPAHALRRTCREKVQELIAELEGSAEMAEKIRAMQGAVAGSDVVDAFAGRAWSELKRHIGEQCGDPDSDLMQRAGGILDGIVRRLREDEGLRRGLNGFFAEQIAGGLMGMKAHATEWIAETVAGWDGDEMAGRLEATVGRDLQFIRLNGTFVGGLIGVAIHGVFWVVMR